MRGRERGQASGSSETICPAVSPRPRGSVTPASGVRTEVTSLAAPVGGTGAGSASAFATRWARLGVCARTGQVDPRGRVGRALHRPLPLRPGPAAQGLALHDIRRVVLLGVPAGGGPFAEVGGPATRVLGRGVGVLVELDDAGDGPIEERAVVGDDHRAAG